MQQLSEKHFKFDPVAVVILASATFLLFLNLSNIISHHIPSENAADLLKTQQADKGNQQALVPKINSPFTTPFSFAVFDASVAMILLPRPPRSYTFSFKITVVFLIPLYVARLNIISFIWAFGYYFQLIMLGSLSALGIVLLFLLLFVSIVSSFPRQQLLLKLIRQSKYRHSNYDG